MPPAELTPLSDDGAGDRPTDAKLPTDDEAEEDVDCQLPWLVARGMSSKATGGAVAWTPVGAGA